MLLFAAILLLAAQAPAHASQTTQTTARGGPAVAVEAQNADMDDDSNSAPKWVWATLVMVGFVALSVVTMVLARGPVRRAPPPVEATQEPAEPPGEHSQAGESEGG